MDSFFHTRSLDPSQVVSTSAFREQTSCANELPASEASEPPWIRVENNSANLCDHGANRNKHVTAVVRRGPLTEVGPGHSEQSGSVSYDRETRFSSTPRGKWLVVSLCIEMWSFGDHIKCIRCVTRTNPRAMSHRSFASEPARGAMGDPLDPSRRGRGVSATWEF